MGNSYRFGLVVAGICAAGCSSGSGSGGGAVTGLAPPSQMGIVTPAAGTTPTATVGLGVTTNFPSGTDYADDPVEVHVYDPALEPLDLINEILCMMSQTGASELVNVGPYIAQIDTAVCGRGDDPTTGGSGQSAGSTTFELWTVDSSRPNNEAAQTVKVWVPQTDGPVPATIRVKVTLTEGASTANPFGAFHMDFAGIPDTGGNIAMPDFNGVLETQAVTPGNIGFTFYENRGDVNQAQAVGEFANRVRVSVDMLADQTAGVARIFQEQRYNFGMGDSGLLAEEYQVAFDATHMLRSTNGAAAVEYSRTSVDERVWRYNLYHATGNNAGERVALNSGFGFSTQGGEYGWIGYYGLWVPPGVTVNNGDTLLRDEFGSNTQTPYTVVTAPGKLIRYTQDQLDLTQIGAEMFEWWDPGTNNRYHLQYALGTWSQVEIWDDMAGEWTAMAPVALNTAALGFLDMWSNSLGGNVAYVHGDTFVSYFRQEFVDGSDPVIAGANQVTLYGYVSCLASAISQNDAENGAIYLPDATNVNTPYEFEFHAADLTLYHDTDGMGTLTQVGLTPGVVPTTGPNTWGMRSGPLVTSTANLNDPWDVWNAAEFYVYETGHNSWNQYAGVKDASNVFVDFDPPLQFTYQHTTADDRNGDAAYNGNSYLLSYNGPGDLYGLPYEGVDLDGDGNDDRHYPVLSLKDGVLMGPTGIEYAVKAVEIEQTMQTDPGGSTGLSLTGASALVLPSGANYVTPDIGAKPTVTAPPRAIGGEIVSGS